MPFAYEHPTYWEKVDGKTKGSGDFQRSTASRQLQSQVNQRGRLAHRSQNRRSHVFAIGRQSEQSQVACL